MKIKNIIMYKMDDCILCKKAIKLFEHWNIPYIVLNIKPYQDRDYPYFDLNGKILEYADLLKLIEENWKDLI